MIFTYSCYLVVFIKIILIGWRDNPDVAIFTTIDFIEKSTFRSKHIIINSEQPPWGIHILFYVVRAKWATPFYHFFYTFFSIKISMGRQHTCYLLMGNWLCCLPPGKITQLAPHFAPPIPPRAKQSPVMVGVRKSLEPCWHSWHHWASLSTPDDFLQWMKSPTKETPFSGTAASNKSPAAEADHGDNE